MSSVDTEHTDQLGASSLDHNWFEYVLNATRSSNIIVDHVKMRLAKLDDILLLKPDERF
jgi:hypothetical protein